MPQAQAYQRAPSAVDEWLTPRGILADLGPFDLDPSASVDRPWPTAAEHYTIEDNGLEKPWHGRVWLNPPYGRSIGRWLERMADHGDGIALIFARTETGAFFKHVWRRASGLLFLSGRVEFCRPDGTKDKGHAPAPSVLVAYDAHNWTYAARNAKALRGSSLAGSFVPRWTVGDGGPGSIEDGGPGE